MADNVGRRGAPSEGDDDQAQDAGRRGWIDPREPVEGGRRAARSAAGRFTEPAGEADALDAAPPVGGRFAESGDAAGGRFGLADPPDFEPDPDEPTGRFAFTAPSEPEGDEPTGRFAYVDPTEPEPERDEPTGRFAFPAPSEPEPERDEPTGRFAYVDPTEPEPERDEPTGRFAFTAPSEPEPEQNEPTGRFADTDPTEPEPERDEPTGRFAYTDPTEPEPERDEPTGRFAFTGPSGPAGRFMGNGGPGGRFALDDPTGPSVGDEAADRSASDSVDELASTADPQADAFTRPEPEPTPPTHPEVEQPPLSGLTPFEPEPTGVESPPVLDEPADPAPSRQSGPALFDWDELRPRTTSSVAMSSAEPTPVPEPEQAPSPEPVAVSPEPIDEVDPLGPLPVEVPWTPEPLPSDAAPHSVSTQSARHRTAEPEPAEDPRRRWYALGALAVVLALIVGVLAFVLRPGATQTTPKPTPSGATSAPSVAPSTSPSVPSTPSASATSAPSSPAATPTATTTVPVSPTAATPGALVLDLGDTKVTLLPGWEVYGDEKVQNDRRLVRLKQLATDTRIQIVTLTSLVDDLEGACSDLMTEHRQSYSGVVESQTVPVAVSQGSVGAACGFTGTRTSDGVPMKVDFTIVRREADLVSLVFRDTVPQAVPADSPARVELAKIECAAAVAFGATIAQCTA